MHVLTSEGAWRGYPPDLAEAMVCVYLGEDGCSAGDVIGRLQEEIDRVGPEGGLEALERVGWVDRFVRDTLLDFVAHFGLLEENLPAVSALLAASDELLDGLFRSGAVGYDGFTGGEDYSGAVGISQRITAYRCLTDALEGADERFKTRLRAVLEDTVSNVGYLLESPDAEEMIESEGLFEFDHCLPRARRFSDPLAILWTGAPHIGRSRAVASAYRRYIAFLEDFGPDPRFIRGRLLLDAEQILGDLYENGVEFYADPPAGCLPLDEGEEAILAETKQLGARSSSEIPHGGGCARAIGQTARESGLKLKGFENGEELCDER